MRLVIASETFGKYAREAFEKLLGRFEEVRRVKLRNDMGEEEIVKELSGADVLVVGAVRRLTREVIKSLPSLKLIAVHGLGLDDIDLRTTTEQGIPVIYCRGTGEEISVAEHTFALMLSASRHVSSEFVKGEEWSKRSKLVGRELHGKTLGIIGLGAVGKHVAKIAKGFGMNIVGYDPYIPDDVFRELGVEKTDIDSLLRRSDFITLHTPLTEETEGLLNSERLNEVKLDVIIVNTSRGRVIDEVALAEKIKQKKVRAVGLDVLSEEPPSIENPLLKLEEATITPHIGAYTQEALERMDTALIDDIIKFLEGQRPNRIASSDF